MIGGAAAARSRKQEASRGLFWARTLNGCGGVAAAKSIISGRHEIIFVAARSLERPKVRGILPPPYPTHACNKDLSICGPPRWPYRPSERMGDTYFLEGGMEIRPCCTHVAGPPCFARRRRLMTVRRSSPCFTHPAPPFHVTRRKRETKEERNKSQ